MADNLKINSDTEIAYTDAEHSEQKYTFENAVDTAERIMKDRGYGPLRHRGIYTTCHTKKSEANGHRKLTLPEFNRVISDVVAFEKLNQIAAPYPINRF